MEKKGLISKISKIFRDKLLFIMERGGKYRKKEGYINFINF